MNELYNLPHRLKKINRFCKSYLNTLESIQNQTETTEFHLIKLQFEEIKILSLWPSGLRAGLQTPKAMAAEKVSEATGLPSRVTRDHRV